MPPEPPSRQSQSGGRSPDRGATGVIRVLFVADAPSLRDAAARELTPDLELFLASDFASALPRFDVEPLPSVVVIDLGLADPTGAAEFLAALVERDYPGPRILLSARFHPREAATLSQSSVLHFALATPWAAGALRTLVEATLGFRPFPNTLRTL